MGDESAAKDSLKSYREKRDLDAGSPEPNAETKNNGGRCYVIQKHDSRNLHFDLRLEHGGVLKSWALPKGPSLDPAEKRLAIRTEDHPVDYADFEGVIPEGYGAGAVMVWDRGLWKPSCDPDKGLEKGELKFVLKGERLQGGFALVRMDTQNGEGEKWLLVKERDDFANDNNDPIDKWDASVKTNRDFEAIVKQSETEKTANILGVWLTHPDRVMFPEQGASKRALAEYYAEHAKLILPYLKGRPLSFVRCPSGRESECFYQKHSNDSVPDEIDCIMIKEKNGEKQTYLIVNSKKALVAAAQIGALELHPWSARADRIERPERVIFDIDPDKGLGFSAVREAALELKGILDSFDLTSFPLLTGGKGVHVIVPIERRRDWDDVKSFAKGVAKKLVHDAPDRYVASSSKSKRKGKMFIDWLRNERGATAIAPFSPRARPNAPIATPVSWSELPRIDNAAKYTLNNIDRRLASLKNDPWAKYRTVRQSITAAQLSALSD